MTASEANAGDGQVFSNDFGMETGETSPAFITGLAGDETGKGSRQGNPEFRTQISPGSNQHRAPYPHPASGGLSGFRMTQLARGNYADPSFVTE